ncbi:ABC transporter ATP-binding protein [Roseomonas elaeocarpi]|uniref:ABC transporter ATP-binding protein n=1 Tax=Roseomonas elaeocarpi TaxID=907779 RepID=A0ABV6JZX7_9PROT
MPEGVATGSAPGALLRLPVLEVRNLTVSFPLRHAVLRAVDGVDFDLHAGRTLCLVGESGSGKSATARAILRIIPRPGRLEPGSSMIYRGGGGELDIASLDPAGRQARAIRGGEIAMIFQEPMTSLSPMHTIGFQIVEAIRLHTPMDRRAARRRAIELLNRVEVPGAEAAFDKYPFEYSGGMRQRAMIAMALACNPKVLIADEPTTALDVTTQAEILDLLRELQRDFGMAVLFITHDMGVVAEIADEVAVMHRGKLVERGPVEEIFLRPQAPYSRMLIRSVQQLEQPAPQRRDRERTLADAPVLLRVEGLSKVFAPRKGMFRRGGSAVQAVAGVALDLREGETLGIVGESGSGKTTLGRCIMRILEPDGGSIRLRRRDGTVSELTALDRAGMRQAWRDMRMIFQDPYGSLNPRMTVGEVVGEPLLVNGLLSGEALRRRVAELLEMVGMPAGAAERYPHAFSGGQRQRISIARAVALEPRLIVADEATSALDVSIRAQVLDLLLEMQERLRLSFLFVSHDIGVVRYFCDRMAVMYRGRIVETGPTERICAAPEHDYTRALLSAVPRPDPRQRGLGQRSRYRGG